MRAPTGRHRSIDCRCAACEDARQARFAGLCFEAFAASVVVGALLAIVVYALGWLR